MSASRCLTCGLSRFQGDLPAYGSGSGLVIPWRDAPVAYGPWGRIYDLFRRWQRNGTWQQILTRLQSLADAKAAVHGCGRTALRVNEQRDRGRYGNGHRSGAANT
ncbi:transposase [Streptomyces sp. NPDC102437]|uniref:transposase n=1 Tax=Streptomyces sp. NPDC102437 TaxID=3366175 RepID=UPI00382A0067